MTHKTTEAIFPHFHNVNPSFKDDKSKSYRSWFCVLAEQLKEDNSLFSKVSVTEMICYRGLEYFFFLKFMWILLSIPFIIIFLIYSVQKG